MMMLITTVECSKKQQKQKHAEKQRALSVPLRNSGKLRSICILTF